MLTSKPLSASSDGLLARKGEASPAAGRPAPLTRPAAAQRSGASLRLQTARPITPAGATVETEHAFTLRLDEQRHLKLRLAAAARGQSAQQIVTEALDAFFSTLPEVEALAAQLPPSDTQDSSGTHP